MNFQVTLVRSFKDFFQLVMTTAAIVIGWQFVGSKAVWILQVIWTAILKAF